MSNGRIIHVLLLVSGVLILSACSAPLLSVSYTLPDYGAPLSGETIFLDIVDQRASTTILTPAAKSREAFMESQNDFVLKTQDEAGNVVSTTLVDNVRAAFFEVFKTRLDQQGWRVLDKVDKSRPGLVIYIEQFVLDANGRTFVSQVTYRAEFFRNGRLTRQDRITGSADNYSLRKTQDASKTISQAFTSSVNALDLSPLAR